MEARFLRNEFQDGSDARPMYGKNATGYIIFTSERRMIHRRSRRQKGAAERRGASGGFSFLDRLYGNFSL